MSSGGSWKSAAIPMIARPLAWNRPCAGERIWPKLRVLIISRMRASRRHKDLTMSAVRSDDPLSMKMISKSSVTEPSCTSTAFAMASAFSSSSRQGMTTEISGLSGIFSMGILYATRSYPVLKEGHGFGDLVVQRHPFDRMMVQQVPVATIVAEIDVRAVVADRRTDDRAACRRRDRRCKRTEFDVLAAAPEPRDSALRIPAAAQCRATSTRGSRHSRAARDDGRGPSRVLPLARRAGTRTAHSYAPC